MSSVAPLIHVQTQDFDVGAELKRLQALTREVGAVASFVGYVRDSNQGDGVTGMTLEHYPGMTEKALADICQRAQTRWPLLGLTVIHRVGPLAPGEQIVLVAVASRHLRGLPFHHGLPEDRGPVLEEGSHHGRRGALGGCARQRRGGA